MEPGSSDKDGIVIDPGALVSPNPDDPLANDVAELWKINEVSLVFLITLTFTITKHSSSEGTYIVYGPCHKMLLKLSFNLVGINMFLIL